MNYSSGVKFLVTGGSGYLGTHLVEQLLDLGHGVVVYDDMTGNLNWQFSTKVEYVIGSILDIERLNSLSTKGPFAGVFHLAAKKSVSESHLHPALYWDVNHKGTANVLNFCMDQSIGKIVFTSSAAVYGSSTNSELISESASTAPENIYGASKLEAESAIREYALNEKISAVILRSFNMAGSSHSDHFDTKGENVIPILMRCLVTGNSFEIFGKDFETRDGTCIRDYVHVSDVAKAHLRAMDYLEGKQSGVCEIFNVSSGIGTSLLDLIHKINEYSEFKLNWTYAPARSGDSPQAVGDNNRAFNTLKWKTEINLDEIVKESLMAFGLSVIDEKSRI